MADIVQITGIEEVREFLRTAAPAVVATGFAKALGAAAKPIEAALTLRTPRGPVTANPHDTLTESQVTEIRISPDLKGGSVEVGFGKQSRLANWVEFGHRNVKGSSKLYADSRGRFRKGEIIGQVPAHPFISYAFEDSAEAAIEAFVESMSETVQNL